MVLVRENNYFAISQFSFHIKNVYNRMFLFPTNIIRLYASARPSLVLVFILKYVFKTPVYLLINNRKSPVDINNINNINYMITFDDKPRRIIEVRIGNKNIISLPVLILLQKY